MHGVALASINNTENQHHDHAGNTATLLGTTYNIPTDSITGSATHHEVPIVQREQRPGTASTPSSFVALEDDMSGARTGFGTATCIVRRPTHAHHYFSVDHRPNPCRRAPPSAETPPQALHATRHRHPHTYTAAPMGHDRWSS